MQILRIYLSYLQVSAMPIKETEENANGYEN